MLCFPVETNGNNEDDAVCFSRIEKRLLFFPIYQYSYYSKNSIDETPRRPNNQI